MLVQAFTEVKIETLKNHDFVHNFHKSHNFVM